MKKTILLFTGLLAVQLAFGQKLVSLKGSVDTVFTTINAAISAASDGDTIHIPGGTFPGFTFSKKLHLLGVGHHPDSSAATLRTVIFGDIIILSGADGSFLSGITIENGGRMRLGSSSVNQLVNDITISRCNLDNLELGYTSDNSDSENIIIRECVLVNLDGNQVKSVGIYNCIIQGLNLFSNALFANNWIGSLTSLSSISNCTFRNNYFRSNPNGVLFSIFDKNLFFVGDPISNTSNTSTCPTCNLFSQSVEATFLDVAGNTTVFDYAFDYHLNPSSHGVNFGTDGNDIGIYGGLFPWKDGSIPYNPHVAEKEVSPSTTGNGSLPVQITVTGQGN